MFTREYARKSKGKRPIGVPPRWSVPTLAGLFAAVAGCGDGIGPDPIRFGQVGEIEVHVRTPLQGGIGWQRQMLKWTSSGAWWLFEEIGYKDIVGEESLVSNPGVPGLFSTSYASYIADVHENGVWGLANVDRSVDPNCGLLASRVTLMIRDSRKDEEREWIRCGFGTLGFLRSQGSGPGPDAARVIEATKRARNFTVGNAEDRYAYTGSLPFATLDKGDKTNLELAAFQVFRSPDGSDRGKVPPGWEPFWEDHTGNPSQAPEIDWVTDMALVSALGMREEVGDSVEIRRVLHLGPREGTEIKIVERIPGDFCTPLHRIVRPYHIVVAPRTSPPVFFSEVVPERVACGGP